MKFVLILWVVLSSKDPTPKDMIRMAPEYAKGVVKEFPNARECQDHLTILRRSDPNPSLYYECIPRI